MSDVVVRSDAAAASPLPDLQNLQQSFLQGADHVKKNVPVEFPIQLPSMRGNGCDLLAKSLVPQDALDSRVANSSSICSLVSHDLIVLAQDSCSLKCCAQICKRFCVHCKPQPMAPMELQSHQLSDALAFSSDRCCTHISLVLLMLFSVYLSKLLRCSNGHWQATEHSLVVHGVSHIRLAGLLIALAQACLQAVPNRGLGR